MKKAAVEAGIGAGTGAVAGGAIAGGPGALVGSLVGVGVVTTHLLIQPPQAVNVPSDTSHRLQPDQAARTHPGSRLASNVYWTKAEALAIGEGFCCGLDAGLGRNAKSAPIGALFTGALPVSRFVRRYAKFCWAVA